MTIRRLPILGFLGFSLLGLAMGTMGCDRLAAVLSQGSPGLESLSKPKVPITQIQDLPKQGVPKPGADPLGFYLEGKVGKQVPLLGTQVYELVDESGKIWVVTSATNLQPGDSLIIQGLVKQQRISIGGKDLGEVYIEEQQQLFRVPVNPTPKTDNT